MKYKVLIESKAKSLNIGDYIQALASSQFLPKFDGFVEREELNTYNDEETRVIMNGWFMDNPENFPPSNNIIPLYVAIHINSTIANTMLSDASIAHFKQNEPIGCRDYYTRDLLLSKGVNAYFSGCMTLTLGYKYKSAQRDKIAYFVDPYYKCNWTCANIVKYSIFLLKNYKEIKKIANQHEEKKITTKNLLNLSVFYKEYSKYFTKETLLNAVYICQQDNLYQTNYKNNQDRFKKAEQLVSRYAKASLVVTSRIHCALPCLGLGTPVIYTEDTEQTDASACRFGGLRNFFTILKWDNNHLEPEFEVKDLISVYSVKTTNKTNWKPFADNLRHKCIEFINMH